MILSSEIYKICFNGVPTTMDNMKQRILRAISVISARLIQNDLEMVDSLIPRLQNCISVNGHHFEHHM